MGNQGTVMHEETMYKQVAMAGIQGEEKPELEHNSVPPGALYFCS